VKEKKKGRGEWGGNTSQICRYQIAVTACHLIYHKSLQEGAQVQLPENYVYVRLLPGFFTRDPNLGQNTYIGQ